jgi:hypothetical protein
VRFLRARRALFVSGDFFCESFVHDFLRTTSAG